ncbi:hypothetical protein [Roseibacillus persicicus]|uniref:Uncharacterized protein n=1 Tax=Roseibacillus persicicus TaxID=454148 RepID=A0A918TJ33_9BACT|nr:hypothetical protein [Roseibacillus persicicus]MDQ8189710.1 hypothetical protein [Roseibacillus persicicus]GHC50056.1 hypothetical protein GCM10007100_15110 [Roseibacillus persicicus]
MFFTPCAVAGYMVYPYINGDKLQQENGGPQFAELNIVLLNSVSKNEIVGSWVLSPRSTGLVSNSLGTSGRRAGISLEAWGGGHANFVIGNRHIEGPIAWSSQPGVGRAPATLHISSADDKFVLRFSKLDDHLVLIAESDSVVPGKKDHIRFLKAS